ncbi:MAG: hypothetical protein KDB52_08515 [Solirubrobacterales bacterium]|nr:hypothetical protein [Solirubrobacterales bacterium]
MKVWKAGACSLLIAASLGLAACGSDDDSSDDSSDSITKAEFVAQANAICAESNKTIAAAEKEAFSGGQPSQADVDSFINDTLLPEVESQIKGIEELPVPEGEEEQVSAILEAANQGLEEGKSDPASLQGNGDPFAEANKLANAYGMTECGG